MHQDFTRKKREKLRDYILNNVRSHDARKNILWAYIYMQNKYHHSVDSFRWWRALILHSVEPDSFNRNQPWLENSISGRKKKRHKKHEHRNLVKLNHRSIGRDFLEKKRSINRHYDAIASHTSNLSCKFHI